MPIYEFKCQGCHSYFEALLTRPAANGEVRCPRCGSPEIVRVLSTFSCQSSKGGSSVGVSSGCSPSSRFS